MARRSSVDSSSRPSHSTRPTRPTDSGDAADSTRRTAAGTSTMRYGDRLGRYVVTGFAGKGATSYVYRARRRDSFKPVAIKVLHPHLVANPAKRRQFFAEARLMLRMEHGNIVEFKEIVEEDGHVGFVMEYIDGVTLTQWLKEHAGRVDEATLVTLFIDVLRGVSHAHERGVIHRDLKPGNIMIAEDDRQGRVRAKIIDFGVARPAEEPLRRKDRDKIVGTAAYISPEEVRDPEEVCAASDLYSLGVMLYEAACGRRPFSGGDRQLLSAHARSRPDSPRKFNPDLSPHLESVILRTLSKHPEGRYESAGEMIDALEESFRRLFEAERRLEPAEAVAETTEWRRSESREGAEPFQAADASEGRAPFWYLFSCLQMALTVLVATGHTGREDDPHHLNRVDRDSMYGP